MRVRLPISFSPPLAPPPQSGQRDETVRVLEIFTDREYPGGACVVRYFWEPWLLPKSVPEHRHRKSCTTRECYETVNGAPRCGDVLPPLRCAFVARLLFRASRHPARPAPLLLRRSAQSGVPPCCCSSV